jgi:hypothetical protein
VSGLVNIVCALSRIQTRPAIFRFALGMAKEIHIASIQKHSDREMAARQSEAATAKATATRFDHGPISTECILWTAKATGALLPRQGR